MKFNSRKDWFFRIVIWTVVAFLSGFSIFGIIFGRIERADYWILVPFTAITAFLLWIYFGTSYELTPSELIYRSGPLKGRIKIDQIREITRGKTLYTGLKPATAGKGLIIRYGKYDEVYISPKTNEAFIDEILKINPNILLS